MLDEIERKNRIKKYARLVAEIGVGVQKGEEVWVMASIEQAEFAAMVVEECYKLGAKLVRIDWEYDPISKTAIKYQTVSQMSKVDSIAKAKLKYQVKNLPSRIYIESSDPDGMKGVNQKKIIKARMKSYPIVKPYHDAMEDKYKWTIVGAPSKAWAKKVFPDLSEEDAFNALWDAILETSRVDENDPVENWHKHNEQMRTNQEKLISLDIRKLKYKASNGTDFEVELTPHTQWGAARETLKDGRSFNPNIPTEEVFTSPYAGKCEGTLVASKPLSYQGKLIEDFSFRFEHGKVVEVKARTNQDVLEQMVKMDEGASMLGEVALVPYDSPINNSGVLFYSTLYDENAACHVALGAGFNMTLAEAKDRELTQEEAKALGINDSMIHVDFMVGTRDLCITGYDVNGKEIPIFVNGEWAI